MDVAHFALEVAFVGVVGFAAHERWPGDRVRVVLACAGAWVAVGLVRAIGA